LKTCECSSKDATPTRFGCKEQSFPACDANTSTASDAAKKRARHRERERSPTATQEGSRLDADMWATLSHTTFLDAPATTVNEGILEWYAPNG